MAMEGVAIRGKGTGIGIEALDVEMHAGMMMIAGATTAVETAIYSTTGGGHSVRSVVTDGMQTMIVRVTVTTCARWSAKRGRRAPALHRVRRRSPRPISPRLCPFLTGSVG